jgi:hypothetical protein
MNNMNKETRIALACFIGATIGALLALQFNYHFWWLGILIGGVIGYLSYQFEEVLCAIKVAWKATWMELVRERRMPSGPSFAQCRNGVFLLWEQMIFPMVKFGFMLIVLTAVGFSWSIPLGIYYKYNFETYAPISFPFAFAAEIIGLIIWSIKHPVSKLLDSKQTGTFVYEASLYILLDLNIATVLCWWVPKGVLWICRQVPTAVCFLGTVVKRTFVLIHSEIRLLCLTDSMIGALIGHWCGNALIGGSVGAVLGVLNYRLISVKYLKLVRA